MYVKLTSYQLIADFTGKIDNFCQLLSLLLYGTMPLANLNDLLINK